MNIKIFFFTLFQNFMVPLDSSWWDLFKSAIAPQFMFLLPSLFGTYLWIFFIFTSVPILKKSCCRTYEIFWKKYLPSGNYREWSPLAKKHILDMLEDHEEFFSKVFNDTFQKLWISSTKHAKNLCWRSKIEKVALVHSRVHMFFC